MNKIKHNKIKNSALLFELLINQITVDTMKGIESPCLNLMKKYFVKTELREEYKLYESVLKSKNISPQKAEILLNEALHSSKKLNKRAIRNQKYNLVKELKEHYDVDKFFNAKVPNYKQMASLYILLENENSEVISDIDYIVNNRVNIIEHISKEETKAEKGILSEIEDDKDLRILTYKMLLENFNKKYISLNDSQKLVLKEYIDAMGSNKKMLELYNKNIVLIKEGILSEIDKVKDKTTEIKLNEILNITNELSKTDKVKDDNIVSLMQYYQLIDELKSIHK